MRLQHSICCGNGSRESCLHNPDVFMSVSVSGARVLGPAFLGSVPINVSELTIQLTLRPLNHFRVGCVRMAKGKGNGKPAKETPESPDQDSDWGVCSSAALPALWLFCASASFTAYCSGRNYTWMKSYLKIYTKYWEKPVENVYQDTCNAT